MKFLLCFFSLGFLIGCQNNGTESTVAQDPNAVYVQLSPAEFKAKLAEYDNPQLIDVRTPREFEKGNIAGAKMINIKDPSYAREIEKLDKNQPVFMYCQAGGRSGKACRQAVDDGFTKIYELKGGYGDWEE